MTMMIQLNVVVVVVGPSRMMVSTNEEKPTIVFVVDYIEFCARQIGWLDCNS